MRLGAVAVDGAAFATTASVIGAALALERLGFDFAGCGEHLFYSNEMEMVVPHKGG